MQFAQKKQDLIACLANSCIFAGVALIFSDIAPIAHFTLPIRELTYGDFLIAAGMIPYLSTSLTQLFRQAILHPPAPDSM